MFTVFGDRSVSAAFNCCTASVLIESNGVSPNAGTRCTLQMVRFAAMPLGFSRFAFAYRFGKRVASSRRCAERHASTRRQTCAGLAMCRAHARKPFRSARCMHCRYGYGDGARLVVILSATTDRTGRLRLGALAVGVLAARVILSAQQAPITAKTFAAADAAGKGRLLVQVIRHEGTSHLRSSLRSSGSVSVIHTPAYARPHSAQSFHERRHRTSRPAPARRPTGRPIGMRSSVSDPRFRPR